MKRYYFDYAAATPVDPRVEKAMKPYFGKIYGNPGALHWFGQEASAAVFEARRKITALLGCDYREIVFTSGATEANNLAIKGIVNALNQKSKIKNQNNNLKLKIIITAIEHESVLEPARDLEREGAEVVYLPVDKNGIVKLEKLKSALDERTVLVSVMSANNEIGTIQPIAEIANTVRNFRNSKHEARNSKQISDLGAIYPLLHTDAAQAFNYLDCDVQKLGVDLLTLSSQKIYGPKGVGLLYIRNLKHEARNPKQILNSKSKTVSDFDIRISDFSAVQPLITGGGQEFGLRSGTENVPGIVGFAKAAELAAAARESENRRLKGLREYFWNRIRKIAPETKLNGDFKNSLLNILNLYFSGHHGQDLLMKLDLAGFAVSPGAACAARVCQPSHVLKALGCSEEQASGSLRFSFGRPTNKAEVDKLLEALEKSL